MHPPSCCHLQVRFHVNNGAGLISATYEPGEPGQLCDGHWHTVTANKTKHGVSVTVDGVTVHSENPHLRATSVDSNNPVYVGGFPGMQPPSSSSDTRLTLLSRCSFPVLFNALLRSTSPFLSAAFYHTH